MSSKDRDVEVPVDDRSRDKTRRTKSERKDRKDRDRDRERDRDRDRDREKDRDRDGERRQHRSSRSTRSKLGIEGSDVNSHASSRRHHRRREKDKDEPYRRERAASTSDLTSSDLNRTASIAGTSFISERISMPYPNFSKAHSKESVVSRESLTIPQRSNPLTPEHTDVGTGGPGGEDVTHHPSSAEGQADRPPSPPETDLDADKKAAEEVDGPVEDTSTPKAETPRAGTPRAETPRVRTPRLEVLEEEAMKGARSKSQSPKAVSPKAESPKEKLAKYELLGRPRSRASTLSRSASHNEGSRASRRSASSSQATYVQAPVGKSRDKLRPESRNSTSSSRIKRTSSTRSHRRYDPEDVESSPSSAQDSSPKTPTQLAQFPNTNIYPDIKPETPSIVHEDVDANLQSRTATPASAFAGAPPPPPPPPVLDILEAPRVDYLLQNGGLAYPAPQWR